MHPEKAEAGRLQFSNLAAGGTKERRATEPALHQDPL